MIITIGNTKGGVGKTTVTTNLAVTFASMGKTVLVIDADPAGSSFDFWELRKKHLSKALSYRTIKAQDLEVIKQAKEAKSHYDYILIDAPAGDTKGLRASLTVTDMWIIITRACLVDYWHFKQVNELLDGALQHNPKLQALIVVNHVFSKGKELEVFLKAISSTKHKKMVLLKNTIGARKAFFQAFGRARSVIELEEENKKATQEIKTLAQEIIKHQNT